MFTFWFKTLPDIPTRHPDYYRAILIYYLLLFLITGSAILAILNQLIFSAPRLALIDISLVFAGLGIYWFFRTTAKVTLGFLWFYFHMLGHCSPACFKPSGLLTRPVMIPGSRSVVGLLCLVAMERLNRLLQQLIGRCIRQNSAVATAL